MRPRLEALKKGELPIYEPGLGEIVEDSVEAGRLNFYASVEGLYKEKSPAVVFFGRGHPRK